MTVSGQSAGGGSVMLQAMAFGGEQKTSLFNNIVAVSPFLPRQHNYADPVPSKYYSAFVSAAGCTGPSSGAQHTSNDSTFQCLITKDTATLQNASATVSGSGQIGIYPFVPVTDGDFVQQRPSQQLLKKQVNGKRMLVGNNANEGSGFTPQNVKTEDDFVDYVRNLIPSFSDEDIQKVLETYPSTNASVNQSNPNFATSGNSTPTAVNQSTYGTGQQQRADNLYAETTFVCPSYWLAEAFSGNVSLFSYKYQYSVIPANHGGDIQSYFGPPQTNTGPDFDRAFRNIWGNFIFNDNPSIPAAIANGPNSKLSTNPATDWPPYSNAAPYQLNLNETGGTPFVVQPLGPSGGNATEFKDPGLRNAFDLTNAYTWEGGRGKRCEFWRSMGSVVPE